MEYLEKSINIILWSGQIFGCPPTLFKTYFLLQEIAIYYWLQMPPMWAILTLNLARLLRVINIIFKPWFVILILLYCISSANGLPFLCMNIIPIELILCSSANIKFNGTNMPFGCWLDSNISLDILHPFTIHWFCAYPNGLPHQGTSHPLIRSTGID